MTVEWRRPGRMRAVVTVLALFAALELGCLPWSALASVVMEVAQRGRAFEVREAEIAPGTTLHFTNEDEFPHQIHVTGPGMLIDSPLQNSGQAFDVLFPAAGTFEVRCGIHPKMRMSVQVRQASAGHVK